MATRGELTPAAVSQRAADLAEGTARAAKRLTEAVRRWDRFFRMRLAIVGAWAVLAVGTLWGACPSSGPTNGLGADVQVLRESFVGGQQILVRNESADLWTDVVLVLDDGWRYSHRTVRPHDQLVLAMTQFKRGEEAAPHDFRPRSLSIRCKQGSHTFDLR
jgi:hypothetical protein